MVFSERASGDGASQSETRKNQPDVISAAMEQHGRVEQQTMLKLIEDGHEKEVMQFLEDFTGVNKEIALKLIDRGSFLWVLAQKERFDDLDDNEIAERLIKTSQGSSFAGYLREFNDLNNDTALALVKEGYGWTIGRSPQKFHQLSEEVGLGLIRSGDGTFIAQHVELFRDVDEKKFALAFLEKQNIRAFFQMASRIDFSLKEKEDIQATMGEALHTFITSASEQAVRTRDYDSLLLFAEWEAEPILKPEAVTKQIHQLIKDENYVAASSLLTYANRFAMPLDESVKQKISLGFAKEMEARERRQERRLDEKKERIVMHEMAQFYADQYVNASLKGMIGTVQRIKPYGYELPFRDLVVLNDFDTAIQKHTHEIFTWMREYLVRAVFSELRIQRQLESSERDVRPARVSHTGIDEESAEAFLRLATEEEIRTYLCRAKERFLENNWRPTFGGKPWANVAEAAERMWKSAEARGIYGEDVCVDIVFDLEHNTGSVFDKDSKRIKKSEEDKKFSNAKRDAHSAEELAQKIQDQAGRDDIAQSLRHRTAVLRKIESKVNELAEEYTKHIS
ncbi:MAG: hypothetical protein WCT24_00725 [Patescibacteria group bacterium]